MSHNGKIEVKSIHMQGSEFKFKFFVEKCIIPSKTDKLTDKSLTKKLLDQEKLAKHGRKHLQQKQNDL